MVVRCASTISSRLVGFLTESRYIGPMVALNKHEALTGSRVSSLCKISSLCAVTIALGVALGAFGAHGLKGKVPDTDLLIWETAVLYHLIHGIAALFLSTSVNDIPLSRRFRLTQMMLLSIFIFSGTLYALVLTNVRWLGAITPLGGVGFILSWLMIAYEFLKVSRDTNESATNSGDVNER